MMPNQDSASSDQAGNDETLNNDIRVPSLPEFGIIMEDPFNSSIYSSLDLFDMLPDNFSPFGDLSSIEVPYLTGEAVDTSMDHDTDTLLPREHTDASPAQSWQTALNDSTYATAGPLCERENGTLHSRAPPRGAILDVVPNSSSSKWSISNVTYEKMVVKLKEFDLPKPFAIPSRSTICRYIEGYHRSFTDRLPIVHSHTLASHCVAPELVLALSVVGALVKFERGRARELYSACKMVMYQQLNRQNSCRTESLKKSSQEHTRPMSDGLEPSVLPNLRPGLWETDYECNNRAKLQTIQALVILLSATSWSDEQLVQDALTMASHLAMRVRDECVSNLEEAGDAIAWAHWLYYEERRRTMLGAYSLLNLHSIAFNVPPMIMNQEVTISLPSPEQQWNSSTESEWNELKISSATRKVPFQAALQRLLTGKRIHDGGPVSAFGNLGLIHAILQHMYIVRQALRGFQSNTWDAERTTALETTLQLWQESWEATHATMSTNSDPDKNCVEYNSTALLRLAYIRLNVDLGPLRQLLSQDIHLISRAFLLHGHSPAISLDSQPLGRAVLQCLHALNGPLRVGKSFAWHVQSLSWGIYHSLCNFECALLLRLWLEAIAREIRGSGFDSLTHDNERLLWLVTKLIQQTDFMGKIENRGANHSNAGQIQRLAACVVRVFSENFRGVQLYQLVEVMGSCLLIALEVLETQL